MNVITCHFFVRSDQHCTTKRRTGPRWQGRSGYQFETQGGVAVQECFGQVTPWALGPRVTQHTAPNRQLNHRPHRPTSFLSSTLTMHTSEYDYLFKLLLIGDSGVGKVRPALWHSCRPAQNASTSSPVCFFGLQMIHTRRAILVPLV